MHLLEGDRIGTATCSSCAAGYLHRALIVTGEAGAGRLLCPSCAARRSARGRKLARAADRDLRAAQAEQDYRTAGRAWAAAHPVTIETAARYGHRTRTRQEVY